MIKKYTIRDIAELAGVSIGTVDRVIHKRGRVSPKALEKVTKLLEEIDYQPNLIARNLKTNKVYHISILVPNPSIDAYWYPCIEGINNVISELNAFGVSIETSFFNPMRTESFSDCNIKIQNTSPDAVLLVPLFYKEALIAIENYNALGIMVSTFNNRIESQSINCFVGQDLHQSGRVAAKLLDGILHKKGDIAVFHIDEKYKNAVHMQEKEKGFRHYFKESMHFKNNIITCKLKRPDFKNTLTTFLKENNNLAGIFVTTSKSYQVAEIIQDITERKIAIIGYDLLDENVTHLKNGTIDFLIHQNPKQQAYLGLKTMAEHLLFKKEIPEQILLPIDIINSENVTAFMRNY